MNQNLISSIESYNDIDWELLLRKDLGKYSLLEANPIFDRMKKILDYVIKGKDINAQSNNLQNKINNILQNFLNFLQQIRDYRDYSSRDQLLDRIKEKEYEMVQELGNSLAYLNFIRPDDDKIIKYKEEIDELKIEKKGLADVINGMVKANELLKKFSENENKFSRAIELAENWIKTEEKALNVAIDKKTVTFFKKADEHKTFIKWLWILPRGPYLWLLAALIFSGVSIYFSFILIEAVKDIHDLSLGASILRISILTIPLGAVIFCAQQFLNHRKLRETYIFKSIALDTMNELIMKEEYKKDLDRNKILVRAIDIIFNEPYIKDKVSVHRQTIKDLKDLLSKNI